MTALGMIVDPPATMVNVTGDNVSSMMVARSVEGKDWIDKPGEQLEETIVS
ncbi:Na+/H+-dicarboxylate symporter [Bacillus iocasae]|uniref:Na+/H+-dicarboxylate symporter n=1 Tax=Priestia iocasae TaxID=2291674 RepID=A0ABS2QWG6_9BACI|nr:Na+/H+-dicarboxylate symporter [Metabacillus iocasae]